MNNKEHQQYVTKMYKENEKLIHFVINKYFYMHEGNKQDLYDAGLEGLLKAIDTYDTSKNYKFNTYAVICIKNSILIDLRRKSAKKNRTEDYTISLNEPVISGKASEDNLTLADTLIMEDAHSFVDDIINREELKEVMGNFKYLTPHQQICLRYSLYYERMNKNELNEISEKLGLSRSYYFRNVFEAKRKLRLIHKPQKECTIKELQEKEKILETEYPIITSIEEFKKYKNKSKKAREKIKSKFICKNLKGDRTLNDK